MNVSCLATLPELRALLASTPHLPDDPLERRAFERAAAWVFRISERLVEYATTVGGRPTHN